MFLLLQLAAHAQDTKYTVTLNVPENGTLSAYAGIKSGDYISRRSEFAAGEEVHLTGSLKAEYSSTGWTDEQGRQVCDSLHYIFTMPAHNVVLTGHTTYDPVSPPGPREDGYTDTWNRLYLRSNPEYGGAFTWGLGAESAQNWLVWTGYEFTVQAYPATGFKFAGWQLDGKIVSTDNPYTFIMPERDMTLYAMYDYDPETPANPHGNVWNKESGELIMSEFVPGYLYNKVADVTRRDPWHSDWDLIKSAIIDGPSTDASLTYDYPVDIRAITYSANNVEYVDYSRTSGITKVTTGCFSKKSLKQVVLPATITTIGEYAFYNCESLTDVTCFATTPPTFEGKMPGDNGYDKNSYYVKWAFADLNLDNIIVHVPAEAVPLYQEARGWKEFMILPITTGVQKLTVTLPSSGGTYKDMFLELVNTKTLQSQRYVITSATSYTFNNLIKGTQHCLYLKNQRGDVLGTVEGIDIQDKDLQVSFADLKTPIDVALRLQLPNGNYLPSLEEGSGVGITWTDRQGTYLGQGATLSDQLEGTQVVAKVKLDETLGRQYQNPADTLFNVSKGTALTIPLAAIPQLTLSGTVTAESTGNTVRGATVTVGQMLNGAYPVTQIVKTDIDGHWTLAVYDVPTTVTVSHSDYLKASVNATALPADEPLDVVLKDITGTIVDIDLSYTAAVADSEEAVTEEGYSQPENITYTVYDETHGKELTDISSQYPILVLLGDELAGGTRLRITATSITGDFMPITTTCTVDSSARATAIFGIKEMGQLKATFEMTDNTQVMGVLYDGDGQLVGWAPYKDTELTATRLGDGDYTLVTMGYSQLFTSVSSLDNLLSLNGMDEQQMVMNEVTIRSGRITKVTNHSIPVLDEDRFRYTSDATSVSVNKSEVTVGSYVTVRAELGFKPAYVDALSKVRLQFDIPEGCEYVDGSMMVGNHTAACEQEDRRITVLIEDLNDGVRFCVVPTQGGFHEISAGTRFHVNGVTTIQPIGAVSFKASDLTFNVVAMTARRYVPVNGMAVPLSKVEVYEGSTLIGETTSTGSGYWNLMCPLVKPYNLSEHSLYAIVTSPEGLQMQSESKTVKVNRGNLTPVVSCCLQSDNFEHRQFVFKWDFRTNEVTPTYAALTTAAFNDCSQTFEVNFYDENDMVANDTTVIRDLTLYVKTSRGDVRTYPLHYSERHKSWWLHLDWHDRLPINVDLDYTVVAGVALDRQQLEDAIAEAEAIYEENRQMIKEVYASFTPEGLDAEQEAAFRELDNLLGRDDLDDAALARRDSLFNVIIDDPDIIAKAEAKYAVDFSEVDALYNSLDPSNPDPETVLLISRRTKEIMAAATQPDDIPSEEEMAAERAYMQALTDSIVTHAGVFRDVMLNSMEWLVQTTDTTALQKPEDGYTEVVSWDDGYQEISYKKLNSIDGEQLVAEGYTAYPMTDGTFIYLRKDGETMSYIDGKTSMLCSVKTIVDDSSVTNAVASRRAATKGKNPLLVLDCFNKLRSSAMKLWKQEEQLKDATDEYGFFKTTFSTIEECCSSTKDALGCIYDGAMALLQPFVDEDTKKCVEQGEADLKSAKDEVDKWKQKIADKKATITQKEKYIKTLERNEKMLAECVENGKNPLFMTEMADELKTVRNGIKAANDEKILYENFIKDFLNPQLEEAKVAVRNAKKFLNGIKKSQNFVLRLITKLPRNFRALLAVGSRKALEIGGGIARFLGTPVGGVFKVAPLAFLITDNILDADQWKFLSDYIEAKLPCPGEADKAQQVYEATKAKRIQHTLIDVSQVSLDLATLIADFTAGTVPVASASWWIKLAGEITSIITAIYHPRSSTDDQDMIRNRIDALKCDKKPDPDPTNPPTPAVDSNGIPESAWQSGRLGGAAIRYNHPNWNFNNVYYVFDPSGYVYEAVNSNRVEGVTTTCYYKETKEDMYGDFYDEAVLWDAENYAQENPLFTDADGRYQWDVPTGLWQVKYEKQGYETTYSDWLPVPPPQLEVNVGITQMKQPNVQKVKACEDGIDIAFDKYMRPNTLKTENIFVTKGGQTVSGRIELLNAESGYQTPDSMYASKVRFVPSNANLNVNDKVQLTVRRTVESYAGVPMEQDFTQQFTVEQRIDALVADSLVNIEEGGNAVVTVKAVPAAAAKGKKVLVSSSDAGAVAVAQQETTLDQNGEAKVSLSALAQGTSIVRFTLTDEEELTTTTLVTVRNQQQMQVATPRSSKINGVTLYIGSEIRLTCATSGATILYTLDGSCPCAPESGKVLTYTGPIVLTGDSIHIKAMAVAPGMEDSPVVEFSYKGIARPDGIEAPTVPDGSPADEDQPRLFFRLNGQRITHPERGVTIERQGSSVKKVVVE